MVDHHIGDRTDVVLVHHLDQLHKLLTIAIQGLDGAFLIEVPKVKIIVWIVAV